MWRLLRVWVVLTATMFVGEGAILSAARLAYRDPFAPYMALRPGDSIDAIDDFPCQLQIWMGNGVEAGSCQFDPQDGVFSGVTVVESKHVIVRTAFDVQPNRLHFGDLVLCWGEPMYIAGNSNTEARTLDVYWRNQVHARVVPRQSSRELSYFLPVTALSIEREWRTVEPKTVWCT